uniref:Bm2267 n=1 Tax=Brugia malayi TaxID=6279 RepID=A0A1I9G6X4_BRUMA|nr:Bm2267 [Brugia malayi]
MNEFSFYILLKFLIELTVYLILFQQDIESLRYEIHWKDSRIDFLQTQLQQMDVNRVISRSS